MSDRVSRRDCRRQRKIGGGCIAHGFAGDDDLAVALHGDGVDAVKRRAHVGEHDAARAEACVDRAVIEDRATAKSLPVAPPLSARLGAAPCRRFAAPWQKPCHRREGNRAIRFPPRGRYQDHPQQRAGEAPAPGRPVNCPWTAILTMTIGGGTWLCSSSLHVQTTLASIRPACSSQAESTIRMA